VRAQPGDRLIIKGHHVGDPDRDGEILEVHGSDGEAPYLVRWSVDGHEGPIIPGSDAVIQHRRRRGLAAKQPAEPVKPSGFVRSAASRRFLPRPEAMNRTVVSLLLLVALLVACGDGGAATSTTAEPAPETVNVFFVIPDLPTCGEVRAFPRPVPAGSDPIRAAFEAQVAGSLEGEEGVSSWFSPATAGAIVSVSLDQGLLTVDLEDLSALIPGASSSCGSEALLAELKATAFQFDQVEEVTFQFDGSCDRFFEFLQMECAITSRPG